MGNKRPAIFVQVDQETIDRKRALPAFYSWRDVVNRGLLQAEREQKSIERKAKDA